MSHKKWLLFSGFIIAFFGPVLTLGTVESTSELARLGLDILSWPVDGVQTFSDPTTRFLSALTGGFLVGWGVTIWCLRAWVYDLAPEGVRRTLIVGTLAWFVFDSIGSITSGNAINAFFNVIVLLLIIGPMWVPEKIRRQA